MRRHIAAALFALTVVPGCHLKIHDLAMGLGPAIQGSGNIQEESREVGAFLGVHVANALTADVSLGEKPTLLVTGDDNLLPLVVSEVVDGKLVVRIKENTSINPTKPLKVTITSPTIELVEASGATTVSAKVGPTSMFWAIASGASKLTIEGIDVQDAEIEVSGASTLSATGKVKSLNAGGSGASTLRLAGLSSQQAKVEISGASNAEVSATERIEGSTSGASGLKVLGSPAARNVSESGASRVSYANAP